MNAMVVVNRQRQTGILTKQGNKYVHVIRMTSAGIVLDSIEEDAFVSDWCEVVGYDVKHAISQYRAYGAERGITQAAKAALDELAAEAAV